MEIETGMMNNYVTDSTHITLADLHPFYTYSCSVAAETVDVGPFTVAVTAQMPEDGKCNVKVPSMQDVMFSLLFTLSTNKSTTFPSDQQH